MSINLNVGSCVRYYAKNSACTLCEDICPTDAIEIINGELALYQDKCTSCGACVGVCPNEALNLDSINVTQFFFDFVKSQESTISCKTNFVCLSGLNVEYLISLGLIKEVTLDIGHCENCDIKEKCFPQIEKNIAEANLVLESLNGNKIIAKELCLNKEVAKERRGFFNIFSIEKIAQAKKSFDSALNDTALKKVSYQDSSAIKNRTIPNKRKVLYTVLKRVNRPDEYKKFDDNLISFTSSKVIDDSCDNCSICYRVCPTEALSTDRKQSKIFFDDMMCIKCKLCHDVCEKGSILLKEVDTKEFFEPTQKVIKEFNVVRCNECGNLFTYFGGEKVCNRCKIEEEEAKSLWGIS